MINSRIPNFRGQLALVLYPPDGNREILVSQLARLGIESEVMWPIADTLPENADVVFFDADRRATSAANEFWAFESLPLIAITGTEAPGRLEAMLAVNPSAILNKPLRREGIFKALVFAYHNQKRRRVLEERVAFQQEQIKARPLVIKTIQLVMRHFKIGDDEAYAAVRSASMSANLVVEAFAFSLMSDPDFHMKAVEQGMAKNRAKNRKTAV
jgi:response regulator NasT